MERKEASQEDRELIARLAREGKIEFAAQDKMVQYGEQVYTLLSLMGFRPEECMVTDLSQVGDFFLDEEELDSLGVVLGFEVLDENYLWEVAEKMAAE